MEVMDMVEVSVDFAQQIVDSAKAVIGWNINFIDNKGIILASTDADRIGKFHEAGYEAARSRKVREVLSDQECRGSRSGINYPIIMEDQVVGVIGITGNPSVVAQYGFLLTKICEVFLKEYWMEVRTLNERQRTNKIVLALLYHDTESLQNFTAETGLSETEMFAVAEFILDCSGDGQVQKRIEHDIIDELRRMGITLYTYIYPNEIVCLIPHGAYERWKSRISVWESSIGSFLHLGIGTMESIQSIYISYRFAKLALKFAVSNQVFSMFAEDMDLELLLQSVDEPVRHQYWERICGTLSAEDIHMLHSYFCHDLSLQQTAENLVIHKNTLQYRLKRIRDKTGLDPRKFSDAVVYYIALRIGNEKYQ
jgi:carbohydrate diacid regulator